MGSPSRLPPILLRPSSITPQGTVGGRGNGGSHPRLLEKGMGLQGPAPAPVTALPLHKKAEGTLQLAF